MKERPVLAPEGTWLAERAIVGGQQMQPAWLTITTEHATLRVTSGALPPLSPVEGYLCVVDAGGWRWRFRGIADRWTVPAASGRGRVTTVAVQSTTSAVAERVHLPENA
jgi:hypothetical protein